MNRKLLLLVAAAVLVQPALLQAPSFASSNPNSSGAVSQQAKPSGSKNVVTFGTQTSTGVAPDARGIYRFGATTGGVVNDHVAVINYANQTVTLLIRPVDALNTPQGGFAARPINQTPRDIGTWITLPAADSSVTLAPRSVQIIPFVLKVPKNASPGDHFGVMTATLVSAAISPTGQRIQLLQTVGTRVFLRVSGPLHPGFTVQNLRVRYRGTANPIGTGHAVLTYTIRNTGNVALGGRQTVYVSGLFGTKTIARHVADVQLLLPGFSVKETVPISGIYPEIRDVGHVSISPLYIAGTVQPASGPYKATTSFWAVPWTLIAIIVAVILVIYAWIIRRRRRRNHPPELRAPSGKPASPATVVVNLPEDGPPPTSPAQAEVATVGERLEESTVSVKHDDSGAEA